MFDDTSEAAPFAAVGGGAAAAFALIALASARRKTSRMDRAVERRVHVSRKRKAGKTARGIAPFGKTYTMVPLALAASGYVWSRSGDDEASGRSRIACAVAIASSAILAVVVEPAFDHFLPQPPLPRGRAHQRPVFPSGHTFKPMALALTFAHVLSQERLAPRGSAYALALVLPVVSGGAKLVSRKHWLSDVAGGLMAGVAIGCACCAGYEAARGR